MSRASGTALDSGGGLEAAKAQHQTVQTAHWIKRFDDREAPLRTLNDRLLGCHLLVP